MISVGHGRELQIVGMTEPVAGAWARPDAAAWLILVATMLMWGGNVVAGRLAVGRISPMALVSLRWAIACSIMTLVAHRRLAADWPALKRRLPLIALLGTMGFTLFNALFYVASHLTTGVNLAILQGATPAMVIAANFLVFRVRASATQAVGLLLTLAGIAVVATHGKLATLLELRFGAGDLLMLVADAFYAAYALGLRWRPAASSLSFFATMSYVACLSSLPLLGYEVVTEAVQWPTPGGWLVLLYVALFPSFVSQLLFMRGVQLIGAARASLFMNLLPVFGAFLSVLFLGEPFGVHHTVALGLVLAGILVAERRRAG